MFGPNTNAVGHGRGRPVTTLNRQSGTRAAPPTALVPTASAAGSRARSAGAAVGRPCALG
eukprot:scaffold55062_cov47-Phaeocystis_antarctica.AAC.3